MKFELVKPCKHCPFRKDETAIRFSCLERAQEIEESAYRNGFVCHEHGQDVETDDASFVDFRDDGSSQHCFGALWMYMNTGAGGPLPWEYAKESVQDRFWSRMTDARITAANALVYESEDQFLESYK